MTLIVGPLTRGISSISHFQVS